jgi:hypothetical protein
MFRSIHDKNLQKVRQSQNLVYAHEGDAICFLLNSFRTVQGPFSLPHCFELVQAAVPKPPNTVATLKDFSKSPL